MRGRTLVILCVVTAAVIAAAVIASRLRAPEEGPEKALLFPGLDTRVNDLAELRVEGKGRSVTVVREGDTWRIREADGYPALFEKVRAAAVGMADLRVVEGKTSNPELYDRLGVEDPAGDGANSLLLTLKDGAGKTLAQLIVGKDRRSSAPGDRPGLYVREPGGERALLAEGRLDVSVEATDWFDRNLADIGGERIRRMEIRHADGETLVLERAGRGDRLTLPSVPQGKELKSEVVVSRMETLLESVFADGVRSADGVDFPEDAVRSVTTTFDGLVARATAATVDGARLVQFDFDHVAPVDDAGGDNDPEAAGEEMANAPSATADDATPDPAAEAARLNDALAGWVFELPAYKFELFTRRAADLLQDEGESEKDAPPLPE